MKTIYGEHPSIADIIQEVCAKHGFSELQIKGHRRSRTLCLARQEVYWRCMQETPRTTATIAMMLGGRNHTTVIKGAQAYQRKMGAASAEAAE